MAKRTDDDLLEDIRENIRLTADAEMENRRLALEDFEFRAGHQWPDAIKRERESKGLPCLVINRLNGFIDAVVGDQRQNRPAIKVHPVDSNADVKKADLLTGLIRNIEVCSSADVAYDTAFDHCVSGGFPGYIRVLTEYADDDTFEQDIRIKPVLNNFSVYFDPYCKEPDSSDARFCAISELMPKEEFEKSYPKAQTSGFDIVNQGDKAFSWCSDDQIRIVEYFYKEPVTETLVQLQDGRVVCEDDMQESDFVAAGPDGKPLTREVETTRVMWCKASGVEILEGPQEWAGRYIPVVPVHGKVINREGKPYYYGLIRFAKDSQRMYNFWRSKATEVIALSPKVPYIGTKKQFEGHESEWGQANTSNAAYLPYNKDDNVPPPQRTMPPPVPAGIIAEAATATDDMKATTGIYDPSLGAKSNETSGRAILARQKESDTTTFAYMDNLRRALTMVGRIIIDLIPKIYDTARIVRIMHPDGSNEHVPVNHPSPDPYGPSIINDLTVGKYDITVDTGPGYQTMRIEAANSMMEFLRVYPQAAPLVADLLVKNMDWPGAEEIAERLRAMLPPQALQQPGQPQQPNPQIMAQQQHMQMQMQTEQAKMQAVQIKAQAEVEKAHLDVQGRQVDLQAKQVEAGHKIAEAHLNAATLALRGMDPNGQMPSPLYHPYGVVQPQGAPQQSFDPSQLPPGVTPQMLAQFLAQQGG